MYRKIKINDLNIGSIAIWLFIMMAVPAISSRIKFLFLFILILVCLVTYKCNVYIRRSFVISIVLWLLFFAFTFINTHFNGYKWDANLVEIYLFRPIVFTIICNMIMERDALEKLSKILIIISFLIGVYNLTMFLQVLQIIPTVINEKVWFGIDTLVIYGGGFFTYRTMNQVALMFLMPYIFIIWKGKHRYVEAWKNLISVTFIINLIICISCGRRILQIETALIIIIDYLKSRKIKHCITKKNIFCLLIAVFVMGCILLFVAQNTSVNLIYAVTNTVLDALKGATDTKSVRGYQAKCLIEMWLQRPLLGWGISAYSEKYNLWRTGKANTSWSYEYFYLALLFQIGLLGIIFAGMYIYTIIKKMLKYIAEKEKEATSSSIIVKAIMWGFVGFLFCGASNPLVTSSWMWFIVISTYNFCIRTEKSNI